MASQSNLKVAHELALKLDTLLHIRKKESTLPLVEVKAPRQKNMYDCGLHSMEFLERLIAAHQQGVIMVCTAFGLTTSVMWMISSIVGTAMPRKGLN